MKRVIVYIVVGAFVLLGAEGVTAAKGPTERRVPPDQAAQVIRDMGLRVPARSCLANPSRKGCPAVTEVVIESPGEASAGDTDYAPIASAPTGQMKSAAADRPTSRRPTFHSGPWACAVEAWRPLVTTGASGHHRNHCYSGVGVTHMEMWGDLLRWNATDARWYSLDNCYRGPYPGATTLACDTYYNCNHPFTTRTYKGSASAYSVVKGIGYFATDYSDTITTTCD